MAEKNVGCLQVAKGKEIDDIDKISEIFERMYDDQKCKPCFKRVK